MKISKAFLTGAALIALATPALAQTDVRQERQTQRIERGVTKGSLGADEAVRLERGQNRIDRIQTRASADGTVSEAEQTRLDNMQDRQGQRIYDQKHDAQSMTNREDRQDSRIENGVDKGSITENEAAHLQRMGDRNDAYEAKASADGNITAGEAYRINARETQESKTVYRAKHNDKFNN